MPRSVFEYGTDFTEGCEHCPFWADGSDNRGYGCAIPAPIMECKYFRQMYEKEESQARESNKSK